VVVAYDPGEPLLRALRDVRSAANKLIRDWRAHPEEYRFESTRRSYRELRPRYAHLAAQWSLAACNEANASLQAWDKVLRRARRYDPQKFEKSREKLPFRRSLKVSLPRDLFRLREGVLDITIRPDHHARVDLSQTRNPMFWRYLSSSGGEFGLAITDRKLIFNFRVPHDQPVFLESAGIDVNMHSADFATSDGILGSVGFKEITGIQGAMARKRQSVQQTIPTDQRAQRRILRRSRLRERNRVTPLLHRAANELLAKIGQRNIIFEDLTETTGELLRERRFWKGRKDSEEARRRLSAWTHGRLQKIVEYKSNTAVLRVNPRGTSSECPQCGGALRHPSWRRSDCVNCQSSWHRDRAAAIVILSRGLGVLRGATLPPRARDALREAAAWRSGVDDEFLSSPTTLPVNGDDAKDFGSIEQHRSKEEQWPPGNDNVARAYAANYEGPGP
jgi:putative transposase